MALPFPWPGRRRGRQNRACCDAEERIHAGRVPSSLAAVHRLFAAGHDVSRDCRRVGALGVQDGPGVPAEVVAAPERHRPSPLLLPRQCQIRPRCLQLRLQDVVPFFCDDDCDRDVRPLPLDLKRMTALHLSWQAVKKAVDVMFRTMIPLMLDGLPGGGFRDVGVGGFHQCLQRHRRWEFDCQP